MRERLPNKTDKGADALRITDQFRTRQGMAYELRERGSRLTLLIAERATPEAGTEWLVEASSVQFPGAAVTHAASTRAEALRRTGVQWGEDCAARGLPSFDWDAVARVLTAVRAI
jgi:hypothetical protein